MITTIETHKDLGSFTIKKMGERAVAQIVTKSSNLNTEHVVSGDSELRLINTGTRTKYLNELYRKKHKPCYKTMA